MKKILIVLSVLLGFDSIVMAGGSSGWTPSVTFRSVLASKYVIPNGSVAYPKMMVQTDLLASFKNGLYIDLWNSTPFEGYDHNLGTEQDLGIGWTGPSYMYIALDVEAMYFDESQMMTLGAEDILYGHAKLSKTTGEITATACTRTSPSCLAVRILEEIVSVSESVEMCRSSKTE